jgi:hypothetical protein
MSEPRPTADALLARIQEQERARLRIYIGAAPGVGKTYEMLQEAHVLRVRGLDVVVGYIETYGRRETEAQIKDLEIVPRNESTIAARRWRKWTSTRSSGANPRSVWLTNWRTRTCPVPDMRSDTRTFWRFSTPVFTS